MTAKTKTPSISMVRQYRYTTQLPFHKTRNPVTHSGRGFRGKFASRKNGRIIRCESLLEKNFLYLPEFARNVVSFDEQPVTINYRLNSRKRRYTPDFCLHWRDGRRWFIEVKPADILSEERNVDKFAAIREYFRREGEVFLTISEHEIYHTVRFPLITDLLRERAPSALVSFTQREIDPGEFSCWGTLVSGIGHEMARAGLAYRLITCSLQEPLHVDTRITVYEETDDVALFH